VRVAWSWLSEWATPTRTPAAVVVNVMKDVGDLSVVVEHRGVQR